MAWSKEDIESTFIIILDRVSNGMSLREVLRLNDMPCRKTFYKWIDEDKEKVNHYARACEERAEVIFEEMDDIAYPKGNDILISKDGKEFVNHDVISRDRLRIDFLKWKLSKMQPKKYGDKQQIEQTNINYNQELTKEDAKIINDELENKY